ncbi:MAG: hypothetical protein AAF517_04195 [Planctomycetota bacterium]
METGGAQKTGRGGVRSRRRVEDRPSCWLHVVAPAMLVLSTLLIGCGSIASHPSPITAPRASIGAPRELGRWFSEGTVAQESNAVPTSQEGSRFGPTEDPDRWRERADDEGYTDATRMHPTIAGFWLPAVKIQPDKDERESNDGLEFDADLATGSGFGVQLSLEGGSDPRGTRRSVGSVGLLYLNSRHSERDVETHAHLHQLFVEARGRRFLSRGPVQPHFGLGVGLGGMILDFDDRFDDTGGIAGSVRGEVGVRVVDHFEVTAGAIGFAWGYPGEWVGYGGTFILGGMVRF